MKMNKNNSIIGIIFSIFLISIVANISAAYYPADGNLVFACGEINAPGTYALSQSISNSGNTCLKVRADNIIIDLNGYNISGSGKAGRGITATGKGNITIQNSVASGGIISGFEYGIYFESSSGNTLTDLSLNSNNYGVYFSSSSDNSLTNINANSNDYGIYLHESSNNDVQNSNLDLNDYGIYFSSDAETSNNLFSNISITNSNNQDVYFTTSSSDSNSLNNVFLDAAFDSDSVANDGDGNIELIRKWHFDAHADDATGNLQDAKIAAYDKNNAAAFTELTDASGNIAQQELVEYIQNKNMKVFSSPYKIVTEKDDYTTDSTNYDLTVSHGILYSVVLVREPLNLTILSPTAVTYNSSLIDFELLSNKNLASCTFTLNGGATVYNMLVDGTGAFYDDLSLANGNYTVLFSCTSTSGAVNNGSQVSFVVKKSSSLNGGDDDEDDDEDNDDDDHDSNSESSIKVYGDAEEESVNGDTSFNEANLVKDFPKINLNSQVNDAETQDGFLEKFTNSNNQLTIIQVIMASLIILVSIALYFVKSVRRI